MQRKHDGGQSHPRPLCRSLWGQLKWCKASSCTPPHLLQTTRSLWQRQRSTECPSLRHLEHCESRGRVSQLWIVTNLPDILIRDRFISSSPSPLGSWKANVTEEACLSEARSFSGLNSHRGAARGSRPTKTGLQQSSSNNIFGDASLPEASRWRRTPLIRILW